MSISASTKWSSLFLLRSSPLQLQILDKTKWTKVERRLLSMELSLRNKQHGNEFPGFLYCFPKYRGKSLQTATSADHKTTTKTATTTSKKACLPKTKVWRKGGKHQKTAWPTPTLFSLTPIEQMHPTLQDFSRANGEADLPGHHPVPRKQLALSKCPQGSVNMIQQRAQLWLLSSSEETQHSKVILEQSSHSIISTTY